VTIRNAEIKALQEEIEKLKANNSRLREYAAQMANRYPMSEWINDQAKILLSETKPQSLAVIKHDAVMDMLESENIALYSNREFIATRDVKRYAKSLIKGE